MKRTERTVTIATFTSEAHPQICTEVEDLADVIAWGDANPTAWGIVMSNRSVPFGKRSCFYMGGQRGDDARDVLSRLASFRHVLEGDVLEGEHDSRNRTQSFEQWKARFTLDHYLDKDFRGGFLGQWDGEYVRGSAMVDFTMAKVDEVIAKFLAWCDDAPFRHETKAVRLNHETIWTPDKGLDTAALSRGLAEKR